MESQSFGLGDIVSLKSHPYLENITDITISGDATHLPPLMVVIEIIQNNESNMFTCLWFSHQKQRFESNVIKASSLKLIGKSTNFLSHEANVQGEMAYFTPSAYEIEKRKSSLSYNDAESHNHDNTKITALLSFLAPPLHIIGGVKPNNQKVNNGNNVIRCTHAVNCMWYNTIHEKFSEQYIPLEALNLIPTIDDNIIKELHHSIKQGKTLIASIEEEIFLIEPKFITSRAGLYFLKGYDAINCKRIELPIKITCKFEHYNKPYIQRAPKLNVKENRASFTRENILSSIINLIESASLQKSYLRIKYKDFNDKVTTRTIKNYSLTEAADDDTNTAIYISAYCMLRKAERTFKLERIQYVEQLIVNFK